MSNISNEIFIARQPILDSNQELFGYELFSRSNSEENKSSIEHTAQSDSEMLFHLLSTFDIDNLLGGKLAFLNCTLELLPLDIFDIISPKSVVLEVQKPSHYTEEIAHDISEKMKYLVAKGFVFAADDFILNPLFVHSLPFITYMKFDASHIVSSNGLTNMLLAHTLGKKVIAEKVETQEQFSSLKKLNVVSYFQGYFFFKPVIMNAKIINPAATNIIRLINMVIQDDDIKNMEEIFKSDPALSFKLLRYINSAGFGAHNQVSSFKHAILLLGNQPLLKWLSILFSSINQNPGADAITKMAVTRACFMELLAKKSLGKDDSNNCFMIGMFSLLEAMLQVPLHVSLGSLNLKKSILDALLDNHGVYAPYLELTLALEKNDWIEAFALAYTLQISAKDIKDSYLEAMVSTETIIL